MPEEVVGKPRRAWLVLLLTLLLQVVFWPLYLLFTFRAFDKQHGRNHPIGFWIPAVVPLAGVFLAIPYAWMELWRLQQSRRARGQRKGIGPFGFILVTVVGPLAALGWLVYLLGTQDGAVSFDFAAVTGKAAGDTLAALAVWKYVALGALWSFTPALALALATASANKLWRAIYAERGESWPWRAATDDLVPAA